MAEGYWWLRGEPCLDNMDDVIQQVSCVYAADDYKEVMDCVCVCVCLCVAVCESVCT